jgi:CHAT domain-containing protein/uncharacterized protein HemY
MFAISNSRSLRFFFLILLAAASLIRCSSVSGQGSSLQAQITDHEQKLADARAGKRTRDEATELNALGALYRQTGKPQKALDYYNEALSIAQKGQNRAGEALTLDNIGRVYTDLGQQQKALDFLNQALPIWRETHSRRGEALTFNNIGRVYSDLGQYQKALDFFNQALPMWRETAGRDGEASTLTNIGRVYSELSQGQKALEFYNQALPIWREAGDRSGEALTLNNTGKVYSDLGQKQKSLDFYNQALVIWRATGNRQGEASTLNNLGKGYFDLGQKQKALDYYNQALPIWREVKNTRGEAYALNSIGRVYSDMGDPQKALPGKLAALSLAKAAGDPELQGGIETALMLDFRKQNLPNEAIFFGMDAVNSYQQIRKNIAGLDKDLQSGFTQSISATYRILAELLVQSDRLGEADQVLDLLKEQELKEVVRGAGDSAAKTSQPLQLTAAQQKAESELATPEKAAEALTSLSAEYETLRVKDNRTADENARLKTLEQNIEKSNADVTAFFKNTLYPELAQQAGTQQDANKLVRAEKSEVSQLQNTLAELGPRVMGVRLLLGEDHAYAIVVTSHTRQKFELKATPAALRDKVLQVRDELRTPASNPKLHLAELYAIVVAPFADELKALEQAPAAAGKVRTPTLLWSLDGALRYLPMNALYDGQHYLIERFNNVLVTPESYGHMAAPADASSAKLRVLAMGLSKSFGGLPALPGVMTELDSVVRDPAVPDSHGPIEGKLLPNEQFTLAALKEQLGAGKTFPVVHIASHFIEQAGSGEEPYLMLGGENSGEPNGFQLTLSRMEDSAISFHGTQLLTLSACSTAKGDAAQDGQEMDSLGMIAQQKDAGAVLATLWDVADASTSELMSDFYARWVAHPADGKSESLRQAQLALLHPNAAAKAKDPSDYSHPFFWAPFVLIGNFQ